MKDIIEKIAEELATNYSNYKIYNESDIISIIKNNILTNPYYKEFIDTHYIFDEFPIQLNYPRLISHNEYKKLGNLKSYFSDEAYYCNHEFIGNEDKGYEFMKSLKNHSEVKYDIGKVNVDLVIVNKDKYNNCFKDTKKESNIKDYNIRKLDYVIQFKYFRNRQRILPINDSNKINYIRKDIGESSLAEIYLDRDKNGINDIINDGMAVQGYFIFVSESNKFKDKFIKPEKKEQYYDDNGYIYLYKKTKNGIYKNSISIN